MERTFKITTRTIPNTNDLYPSERRYSASTVAGLSILFLFFSLTSALMASLVLHKIVVFESHQTSAQKESIKRLTERIEKDTRFNTQAYYLHYYVNVPAVISATCYAMAAFDFVAFVCGMLAWKRWYIDHNITFFFLSSAISAATSLLCLIFSALVTLNTRFDSVDTSNDSYIGDLFPVSISLAANIIVLSVVNMIWSLLSVRVGYRGMRSQYPEDVVASGGRNVSAFSKDVMSNLQETRLAKYFPKKQNDDLPKAENSMEYRQRVDKFLSGESEELKN